MIKDLIEREMSLMGYDDKVMDFVIEIDNTEVVLRKFSCSRAFDYAFELSDKGAKDVAVYPSNGGIKNGYATFRIRNKAVVLYSKIIYMIPCIV